MSGGLDAFACPVNSIAAGAESQQTDVDNEKNFSGHEVSLHLFSTKCAAIPVIRVRLEQKLSIFYSFNNIFSVE